MSAVQSTAAARLAPESLGGSEKHVIEGKLRAEEAPEPLVTFTGDDFALADPLPYTSLILDLGDVLAFHSGRGLNLPVPAAQFRHILDSPDWHAHECNQLGRDECFARLASKFGVEAAAMAETVRLLSGTLTFNERLLALVRHLKAGAGGRLKVYLASNITAVDWELFRPTVAGWHVFDGVYTSFELGARKPDRAFYQRLAAAAGIEDLSSALFVDDKSLNLVTARILGMHCLQFDETENVITELKTAFGEPVRRGEAWLRAHAGTMWSGTQTGIVLHDRFAQLLLLEITKDRSLVTIGGTPPRTWNTFIGAPVLTTATYPDDLDSTALGFLTHDTPSDLKHAVMDEMLQYMRDDGLFYTYFDKSRPRIDLFISANVLRLFYAEGRGAQVRRTLELMCEAVRQRAYEYAMHYYTSPDWLFYYLSELCAAQGPADAPELAELRGLLAERLAERFGYVGGGGRATPRVLPAPAAEGRPLHDYDVIDHWGAALRAVSAHNLGLADPRDLTLLRRAQQPDGAWGRNPWIYRYGHGLLFHNVGLCTAMAVRALQGARPGE